MTQQTDTKPTYSKGLEGVIAAETGLSFVDGKESRLYYRGISIEQFVGQSSYEDVAYLLWNKKLPTDTELDQFKNKMAKNREIPDEIKRFLKTVSKEAHPMAVLRTAVSYLGCLDKKAEVVTLDHCREIALELTCKIPTIIAGFHRSREGLELVDPDTSLSHAENFLYMLNGEKPSREMSTALDTYLILLADHGFNASTFSARVTISTQSDMYSAITAAIGTLKGDLHGSAVQRAMELLLAIGEPANAESYIKDLLNNKKKVMGFGHRIYKERDPRADAFRKYAHELSEKSEDQKWIEISTIIERVMQEEKGIPCNVDFFSSYVLYIVGFPVDFFTTIFAASRIAGWTAHVVEQISDNKLMRPKALYVGPHNEPYIPIQDR